MSYLSTTITLTRDVTEVGDVYGYSRLSEAIRDTLQNNFYTVLKRNKINTISSLYIDSNIDGVIDVESDIVIEVSQDDTIIYVKDNNGNEITRINYTPYLSKVKYSQYVSNGSIINKYKTVCTVLLNIVVDQYICGFSILSPSDIQLVDKDNNIYAVKTNIDKNVYSSTIDYEDESLYAEIDLPETIKLQSSVINDPNSYYELKVSSISDPYNVLILPCVNTIVYSNGNQYTFNTLFGNHSTNFIESDDETVIGTVLMNNKLLVTANTETIQGFAPTIFDVPALNVSKYWIQDASLNVGDTITVDDSDYIISDKNTLIQISNTEVYGVSNTAIYNGKSHFFNLVYPQNAKAYYRENNGDTNEDRPWTEFDPANVPQTYINVQSYTFDYKVDIFDNDDITQTVKTYYGQVYLDILSAEQYGYLVDAFVGEYDALPHTLYIYASGSVEYSTDAINWTTIPPVFTEVGNHKVYYRITEDNYTTIVDSVEIIINDIADKSELDFGIDISKNIIVMRQQMYANIPTNLFLMTSDNNVYISDTKPTSINMSYFTGKFPKPYNSDVITEILGQFKVSPNNYYMILECYLPWYYHGVEPSAGSNTVDVMVSNNPVNFTVEYTNEENPDENTTWIPISTANKIPSNGFYQYKLTDINLPNNSVGNMLDVDNTAQPSTKRAIFKLPLSASATGTSNKIIRIKCTHTGNVLYEQGTSQQYKEIITSENLGVSLVTFSEYPTPTAVDYSPSTVGSTVFSVVNPLFKSRLTQDAYFSFNVGENLQFSGCGKINYNTETVTNPITQQSITYQGVDSTTGLFDSTAYVLWRSGAVSSIPEQGQLWNETNPFTVIRNWMCRIQFNSDKLTVHSIKPITTTNTDKIYEYVPCKNPT